MIEFTPFPKIARLNRNIIITEKIDGTNAAVGITIQDALAALRDEGSRAAPGFMDPEGVVVYMAATRSMFKVTIKNDEAPKSQEEA